VRNAVSLARALGVLDHLQVVEPSPADDRLLRRVHTDAYIEAVRAGQPNPFFALGTEDNPCFPRMHEVSSQVVTASVDAAAAVWRGEVLRAVNIAGGLHHAMPSSASGFCIYNDLAIAIHWLLEQGCERVAYVDVDVHHGDGVQSIFYNDPRVLTISLHESPVKLFPGTGYPHETGGPDAEGSAINIALPSGTDDHGWLRAFDAIVPEALAAFKPTILVTQHGCDSHYSDPLADLRLTVDGQRASYLALSDLAVELTGGRWVAAGGGGYALLNVVPRAWAHLLAIIAGHPIPPETSIPQTWRDEAGDGAPMSMTDGCRPADFTPITEGIDPSSRVDQAILATRRAAFPDLGLDPGL
jgi:acetoin utilization protein AcuC